MKGKVDINGLKQFKQGMEKMNNVQRQQWSEAAIKELAAHLLRNVINRTLPGQYPAGSGKIGGTLRRGWTVGKVVKTGSQYTIQVINPVEYAPYVEFGHRTANHSGWVKGKFMLTISEMELQKDAPRILMNKLKTFMGGMFV